MPRALVIVDVQPTFCEGGALPVEGGNACAQRVADFVAAHARPRPGRGHRRSEEVTS